eukprot:975978_1
MQIKHFMSVCIKTTHFASSMDSFDADLIFKWNDLSLFSATFRQKSKEIIYLGTPIAFSVATQFLVVFTDQAVVGHLGTDYLAAAALAGVIMTISSIYIFAFCSTINVLSSQAYGAKNYKLVSEWYQLGCVLSILMAIPPAIVYLYTEQILHHVFGTHVHMAHLAGIYAKWSIISIVPQTQFMATEMYFQSQSNVIPVVVVCCVAIIFNLMANLILVYGYLIQWIARWNGLGFIGSPIATATTSIVQYLLYIGYMFIYKKHHAKTWSSLKLSTFSISRIKAFMAVAIPQTLSQALEEWQIQVIVLITSQLDAVSVAAFASLETIFMISHCFALGLCDAISVKVGNALGGNKPLYAKYISWVAVIIALISGAIVGCGLGVFGPYLSRIVSGAQEMYQIYKNVCPMVGISYFMLNVLTTIWGVLIGQARTTGLVVLSLVACWGCTVPLCYILGIYLHHGITGIYVALIIGYGLYTIGIIILFLKSDWTKCAQDAVQRSKQDKQNNQHLLINDS